MLICALSRCRQGAKDEEEREREREGAQGQHFFTPRVKFRHCIHRWSIITDCDSNTVRRTEQLFHGCSCCHSPWDAEWDSDWVSNWDPTAVY